MTSKTASVVALAAVPVVSLVALVAGRKYRARKATREFFQGLGSLKGLSTPAAALLEAGADVNHRDQHGSTLLHYAVERVPIFVQPILDYGADVNAQDHAGFTPLMGAVLQRNLYLIPLLLKAGADPNLAATTGDELRTPLAMTELRLWLESETAHAPTYTEIIQMLKAAGARA